MLNVNWPKIIGIVGMGLSAISMVCNNISQKDDINKAASKAAEKAVKEILKNKES